MVGTSVVLEPSAAEPSMLHSNMRADDDATLKQTTTLARNRARRRRRQRSLQPQAARGRQRRGEDSAHYGAQTSPSKHTQCSRYLRPLPSVGKKSNMQTYACAAAAAARAAPTTVRDASLAPRPPTTALRETRKRPSRTLLPRSSPPSTTMRYTQKPHAGRAGRLRPRSSNKNTPQTFPTKRRYIASISEHKGRYATLMVAQQCCAQRKR